MEFRYFTAVNHSFLLVPSRPRRFAGRSPLLGLTLTAALLLVGCGGASSPSEATTASASPAEPTTITAYGSVTLRASSRGDIAYLAAGCRGTGGYSDLAQGAQVVVQDGSGTTLAIGQLDAGIGESYVAPYGACQFGFTVPGAPAGKGFYRIEISHRGAVNYTEAQLDTSLALTIGG